MSGSGHVGPTDNAVIGGQLVVFGPGDHIRVTADHQQSASSPALEVITLGGHPIREPVAWYGPFVMNTHAELDQAMEDYRAGRLRGIPPGAPVPHRAPKAAA